MSLLPNVERELLRVAYSTTDESPAAARVRVPAWHGRLSGGMLAVAVSVVAVLIGAGFVVALRGTGGRGGSAPATRPPRVSHGTFPGAPHPAPGHFTQRGRFVCRRAPRNRYLPHDAGCVSSVLRADMTGARQADLVVIYANLSTHRVPDGFEVAGFTLEVVQPGGRIARTRVQAEPFPWITRVGNVDGVPGDELVLHTADISSGDGYELATFHGARIELMHGALYAGGDSAAKEGFFCHVAAGNRPVVVSRVMVLLGPTIHGRWRWTVRTYVFHGARLFEIGHASFVRRGLPGRRDTPVGAGCGRPTGATQANPR